MCFCFTRTFIDRICCLEFFGNNKFASGSMDYTIKILDIEKKACLVTIDTGTYFDVAYSLKLITLNTIACGSNKSIKIYNIGNGMCFKILKGHVDFVNCLILTKGGILISGSDDKTIKFWDTNEGIYKIFIYMYDKYF